MGKINENYDSTLAQMKHLINFGESIAKTGGEHGVIEYQQKGADGKTYGIIREGQRYYIKVSPKADAKILSEDFDYIGGFNERKSHEYTSYSSASQAFDFKMKSLNEAYNKSDDEVQHQFKSPLSEAADWKTPITEDMRKEIDRFKRITENADYISAKDKKGLVMAVETGDAKDGMAPFTEKGDAPDEDKDVKRGEDNYKKAGKPYNPDGKEKDGDNGIAFKEMPTDGKESVANKRDAKKTGRVIRFDEKQLKQLQEMVGADDTVDGNEDVMVATDDIIDEKCTNECDLNEEELDRLCRKHAHLAFESYRRKKSLNEDDDIAAAIDYIQETDPEKYDEILAILSDDEEEDTGFEYYGDDELENSENTEDDEVIYEAATRALINVLKEQNYFGMVDTFQKPAFTTPDAKDNKPYATKRGKMDPFIETPDINIDNIVDGITSELMEKYYRPSQGKKKIK